jgi:hypothetical protein
VCQVGKISDITSCQREPRTRAPYGDVMRTNECEQVGAKEEDPLSNTMSSQSNEAVRVVPIPIPYC